MRIVALVHRHLVPPAKVEEGTDITSAPWRTEYDVISVLRKKRERVTDYRIEIRGERREEHPRSFRRIEVRHIVTGFSVNEKSVARAVELSTEKYCSVAATLRPTAEIVSSYEIREQAPETSQAQST